MGKVCEKIENALPIQWKEILSITTRKVQDAELNFLLKADHEPKCLEQLKTNFWYNQLLEKKHKKAHLRNSLEKITFPQFGTISIQHTITPMHKHRLQNKTQKDLHWYHPTPNK